MLCKRGNLLRIDRFDGALVKLLSTHEVAMELDLTEEHVIGLARDGKLRYNVGRGGKRPRYRFTREDVTEFVEANRTREEPPCQSSKSKGRRTINMNLNSKVLGFAELRAQRTSAKRRR